MDKVGELVKKLFENNLFKSIVVIIVSFFIYQFVRLIINKATGTDKVKNISKKGKTYMKLITSVLRYIFLILTVLVLLQVNGINVSSLLAGLGIASVIIGLAVQDALKDIIRGFSILGDSYFVVGDVVKYGNIEGKVLVIGLRTTKVQDLATCNIVSIANRNIEQIEVVSNKIYVDIPLPYEVSLDKAENAIADIVENVKTNDHTNDCKYLSVTELGDSAIKYLIEITCNPENKRQVRRDALRTILDTLAKHKIEVPYTQIDIHNK